MRTREKLFSIEISKPRGKIAKELYDKFLEGDLNEEEIDEASVKPWIKKHLKKLLEDQPDLERIAQAEEYAISAAQQMIEKTANPRSGRYQAYRYHGPERDLKTQGLIVSVKPGDVILLVSEYFFRINQTSCKGVSFSNIVRECESLGEMSVMDFNGQVQTHFSENKYAYESAMDRVNDRIANSFRIQR